MREPDEREYKNYLNDLYDNYDQYFTLIDEYTAKGTWETHPYIGKSYGLKQTINELVNKAVQDKRSEMEIKDLLKMCFRDIVDATIEKRNESCLTKFVKEYGDSSKNFGNVILDVAENRPKYFRQETIYQVCLNNLPNQEDKELLQYHKQNNKDFRQAVIYDVSRAHKETFNKIEELSLQNIWSKKGRVYGTYGVGTEIDNLIRSAQSQEARDAILFNCLEILAKAWEVTNKETCLSNFITAYPDFITKYVVTPHSIIISDEAYLYIQRLAEQRNLIPSAIQEVKMPKIIMLPVSEEIILLPASQNKDDLASVAPLSIDGINPIVIPAIDTTNHTIKNNNCPPPLPAREVEVNEVVTSYRNPPTPPIRRESLRRALPATPRQQEKSAPAASEDKKLEVVKVEEQSYKPAAILNILQLGTLKGKSFAQLMQERATLANSSKDSKLDDYQPSEKEKEKPAAKQKKELTASQIAAASVAHNEAMEKINARQERLNYTNTHSSPSNSANNSVFGNDDVPMLNCYNASAAPSVVIPAAAEVPVINLMDIFSNNNTMKSFTQRTTESKTDSLLSSGRWD